MLSKHLKPNPVLRARMRGALLLFGMAALLAGCGDRIDAFVPPQFASKADSPTAVVLTAIVVAPPDAQLAPGSSSQFTATGFYSDGSRRDLSSEVSWSLADPTVASLADSPGAAGLATALRPGSTTVTASMAGVAGSAALSVTSATLVSIGVTPVTRELAKGTRQQFVATGVYSDNSTQDLTISVAWSSSHTTVASVSNTNLKGQALALNPGTTRVTATLGAVSGATELTVTSATLVAIGITPATRTIANGRTSQFTATGVYTDNSTQDLTTSVTWASADSSVASISNAQGSRGLASSIGVGTTAITASLANVSGSAILKVTSATLVSIEVSPSNPVVANGVTTQFTATGIFTDNSTQDVTRSVIWASSAPTIAAVSNASGFEGRASALLPGSATVSARLGTVSGATSLTVTAAKLVSLAVTPAAALIANGTQQQFTAIGTYTDNSTQDLTAAATWASSALAVATISNAGGSNGLAVAAGPGSTNISATLGSVSGSTALTVTAATLVSINVTPANPTVANGTQQQFTATGTYSDSSTQDLTTTVTWDSSMLAVATISNAGGSSGLASAAGGGSTSISATIGSISGSTTLTVTSTTLVSIDVTPAHPSIAKGAQRQFTATGTYSDNSTQDLTAAVTWDSSMPAVATISNAGGSNGLASSASVGSTNISATLGTVSGSTSLTVTAATLVSIAVTPAMPSIANGTQRQFTATGTYSDNSTQDLTAAVTWDSSMPAVATISNAGGSNGLASSASVGSTSISATLGSVSGSTSLTVTAATLVSIAVTPANLSIANGTQRQFTATGTYSDNSTQNLTAAVTWDSSTPAVATISNAGGSNGLASSASVGATNISATLGTVSGSTSLTVTAATLVSIAVTPAMPSIAKGLQRQFTATGTYSDNSTQNLTATVTWSSGTPAVATISNAGGSNGLASSVAVGTTNISATLGSVSGSTTLTVTAATLVSIAVTPAAPTVSKGTQRQFTATGTYTDNSTQNLTATAVWSSSVTSVATVGNSGGTKGLASSPGMGSSTITARVGTVSGSTTLTVTAATLVSIAITPPAPSIPNGTQKQLTATGTYTDNSTQDLTTMVTWDSSDLAVATVGNAPGSNGLAIALGIGSASIHATLGAIVSPIATLTVNDGSTYAYVANNSDNTVTQFRIDAAGALTPIGLLTTGPHPTAIAVDPRGRYVYVVNQGDDTISAYAIGAGGAFTTIGAVGTGSAPISCAIDPSGQNVYVANLAGNSIWRFTIGSDGALSYAGETFTGSLPSAVAIDPTGRYAYAVNFTDNSVSQYRIGPTGTLSSAGAVNSVGGPNSIAVESTGHYAYVANIQADTLNAYAIGPNGALSLLDTVSTGGSPISVATDPDARYVYVVNGNENSISSYSIAGNGSLTSLGPAIATGVEPTSVSVDPSGKYVYVTNSSSASDSVSRYTIDVGGTLTPNGTAATGAHPLAVATGY